MWFWLSWGVVWIAAYLARTRLTWLFPAVGVILLVLFKDVSQPLRLAASSLGVLYMVKAAALTNEPALNGLDRLIYFTAWPGMDAERLSRRQTATAGTGHRFGEGLSLALMGLGGIFLITISFPVLSRLWVGWLGIAALLLTIHFGFSQVLTALLRLSGRPVRPLFDRPLASATLSDFWSKRWNLAYVEMNRRLFFPLFKRKLGVRGSVFAVFLISGVLHEMAISYPAGAGYGLPLIYFTIQGIGVLAERKFRIRSRLLTWLVILVPLPLLFHQPFREQLIIPLFEWLNHLWRSEPPAWYVSNLLWLVGAMQLCVLLASGQVPKRLRWREELPRLSPFNQKLMWTYGIFIVTTIVSFAVLTLVLHDSFLQGERAAVALAVFMSIFWVLRLAFDFAYFKSEDWPPGEDLKVGHAMLNALFLFLVLAYGVVAAWGMSRH